MRAIHAASISLVAAAALVACAFASPAQADWGDGYRPWHPQDGWYRPLDPPTVAVAPRPYHYVRTPAYYAPPPVAYEPPPAYYAPDVSLGLTVR